MTAGDTERLVLRVPRLSDAAELLHFLGDRDAMRYTFHVTNLRGCRRHIAAHDCQRRKKGYGPWTVVEKASGRIIGFGGLMDDPFDCASRPNDCACGKSVPSPTPRTSRRSACRPRQDLSGAGSCPR